MKVAIYARVSSMDQDWLIQLEKLREHARRWEWESTEYVEKLSGKEGKRRPQLEKLLHDATRREFEAVLVWKMDRFGRSTLDTLTNVKALDACGVRFISLYEGIDTTDKSPVGRFTLTIFSAVAELERSFIVERTQGGFVAYRKAKASGPAAFARFIEARGRHSKSGKDLPIGRPKVVVDRVRVREFRAKGCSLREIGRKLKVSYATVARLLAEPAPIHRRGAETRRKR